MKQNYVTLPDQPNVIQNSYSPTPETCTVENINNDKEWVQDYIVIRGGEIWRILISLGKIVNCDPRCNKEVTHK